MAGLGAAFSGFRSNAVSSTPKGFAPIPLVSLEPPELSPNQSQKTLWEGSLEQPEPKRANPEKAADCGTDCATSDP
jgi:hypothetical protein